MALSTYADLQTSVASWLARTDLTTQIPDFVALAESRMNRELRVREMITTETGTVTGQDLDVPTDFIEVVRIKLDTESDLPLEYRPLEDSEQRVAAIVNGQPRWFTILGTSFKFYPSPDTDYDYTLDYYATLPALSDTDQTNWLILKAPDLYLFGALAEAAPYLMDDARVAYWESRYQQAKSLLQDAEFRSKRTSGPLRMRVLV